MSELNQELSERLARFTQNFVKGDIDSTVNMHTDDTCIMPQNSEKIIGKEAVKNMYQFILSNGLKDIKFTTEERLFLGDIVVERGEYWQLMEPDNEDRGNYVTVWKKVNNEWLFHWDTFNTNLPP